MREWKIKRQRHHWIFPWHPKGQQMMTHWWHTEMLTKTETHTVGMAAHTNTRRHTHRLTRPEVSSWAGPVSSIGSGGWDGRSADDKPSPSPRESRPPIGRTQMETCRVSARLLVAILTVQPAWTAACTPECCNRTNWETDLPPTPDWACYPGNQNITLLTHLISTFASKSFQMLFQTEVWVTSAIWSVFVLLLSRNHVFLAINVTKCLFSCGTKSFFQPLNPVLYFLPHHINMLIPGYSICLKRKENGFQTNAHWS